MKKTTAEKNNYIYIDDRYDRKLQNVIFNPGSGPFDRYIVSNNKIGKSIM
jgi:hypothetical protein